MALTKTANAEPIPGYRLVEPLGSGGFGEVWKCTAPGGFHKAIKFIAGAGDLPQGRALARQELMALEHVREIRHPFLLTMERVEVVDGELCIVMELADSSLQDLLASYQQVGRPGIPRDELLGYLCEAAEALDILNVEHGLQHLDVKPGNLFLVGDHVKVADFGLVQAHRHDTGGRTDPPQGLSPLYAAPEVFQNKFSNASDQYSLAIVYYELLTGQLPFTGKTVRQLMLQHATATPNIAAVPANDQPMLAKALAKDPTQRFASCQDLVEALVTGRMDQAARKDANRAGRRRFLHEMRRRLNAADSDGQIALCEPPVSAVRPGEPTPVGPSDVRETTSDSDMLATSGTVADRQLVPDQPQATFKFVQSLSENPLGSWWHAVDEKGQACLVKMLGHYPKLTPDEEAQAALKLQRLAHPGLLAVRRVVKEPGRILLMSDLVPDTLWGHWQRQGRDAAINARRDELLGILGQVAQTVDEVAKKFGCYHWTLNPQNVLLDGTHVRVAELGLAQLFWQKSPEPLGYLNPRCGAPELFATGAEVDGRADVFALGVTYLWLMTGQCPFRPVSTTRAGPRSTRRIDLDTLARPDRRPVAKALQRDPRARYATCSDFINALEEAWHGKRRVGSKPPSVPALDVPATDVKKELRVFVDQLASANPPVRGAGFQFAYEDNALVHKCGVRVVPGMFELKLRDFCQRWGAAMVTSSAHEVRLKIQAPTRGLWDRLVARERSLAVTILVEEPAVSGTTLTTMRIRIAATGCATAEAEPMLRGQGLKILESLRSTLLATNERRQQERFDYAFPLAIAPAQHPNRMQHGVGKDISVTGLGMRMKEKPDGRDVFVFLPVKGHSTPLRVPGRVVRMQACADGGYELGVQFNFPSR